MPDTNNSTSDFYSNSCGAPDYNTYNNNTPNTDTTYTTTYTTFTNYVNYSDCQIETFKYN